MKVSKGEKAQHRTAILDAAAVLFRQHGFEGVTVAEIMDAAGLTHGGFYGHFTSKDDLIAQSVSHALLRSTPRAENGFPDYVDAYLSASHRLARGEGCVFAALGSEAVRVGGQTCRNLTAALKGHIDRLSETAPGETADLRRGAAIAGWSAMVGALILSRISDDPSLAVEILAETGKALSAGQVDR